MTQDANKDTDLTSSQATQQSEGGEASALTPSSVLDTLTLENQRLKATLAKQAKANQTLEARLNTLTQTNAELLQFAAKISHDLHTPLRTIAGFSKLLADRYKGQLDTQADGYIDFILSSTNQMQAHVSDLLAYARLEQTAKAWTQLDCEAVLAGVLQRLDGPIERTQANISHSALPTILAEPILFPLLLHHLLDNALKFHSDQAPDIHISVTSTDQPAGWVFTIQDNGIGFDNKFATDIFQVFRRLHTADAYPGTGMGLTVCKKIVTLHGGQIWAEATPNAGATFSFTLPQ
ncbi:MAG: ATP-binding protein [Chloroflexota bacterium]